MRRTLYWTGTVLAAAATIYLLLTHWQLAVAVLVLFLGIGLRQRYTASGDQPDNLAQVAQALHKRAGLTVEEAWGALEEIVADLGTEDVDAVWDEATSRYELQEGDDAD